ncbi:unnamed protein product [Schistocephalus solidus]|uniref:G_PROTEIN_RECEP_F1_2 domain-containing protein n=1 Tax=Schistocephalus solidus TaxID=70667 RepID=A0A183TJC2_SCHSO|nr:unnamed protein product [Schistocephalus solidus]
MDKAYWQCPHAALKKDALFNLSVIINFCSMGLNLGLLVLLILLKGKARMFLHNFRAMGCAIVVHVFIRICDRVIPSQLFPTDPFVAATLCYVWKSHYLSLVTYTFVVIILYFTVGNRAIQVVCRYQYSYSTSVIADLVHLFWMALLSTIFMVPQALIVQWDGKRCNCVDEGLKYEILVSLYTGNFVRFGLTAIIGTIILGISCYKIIFWVRNTPSEQLSDTWNLLTLPGTTKEQMDSFSQPQGWMTATLCTVPLSVNVILISIYETGYNFICALGFCTVVIDSPTIKIDRLLADIQLIVLPITIFLYIPALRELAMRVYRRLISLGMKLCMRGWRADDNGN